MISNWSEKAETGSVNLKIPITSSYKFDKYSGGKYGEWNVSQKQTHFNTFLSFKMLHLK